LPRSIDRPGDVRRLVERRDNNRDTRRHAEAYPTREVK
jgi:hypothetical protein